MGYGLSDEVVNEEIALPRFILYRIGAPFIEKYQKPVYCGRFASSTVGGFLIKASTVNPPNFERLYVCSPQ